MMHDFEQIIESLKLKIIEKFQSQKTELFLSNGTVFGRNWKDLTPKYKEYKLGKIGKIYPINIFTGEMLKSLLENALVIESDYDGKDLKLTIDINSDRMNLDYTNYANEQREFILFSDEEKQEIVELVQDTIKEYFAQ
jgi:hypothetical protein